MKIEIRSENEAFISGYVNAVERESKLLSKKLSPYAEKDFVEKIRAGTFRKALENADNIQLRFNHNAVLGDTKSENLRLKEDNIGLYAEAVITDKSVIREMRDKLQGWSFGFSVNHDEWSERDENTQCRIIDDIDLHEVSLLTVSPAYAGTSVEMRGENCLTSETRGTEDICNSETSCNMNELQKKQLEIIKMKEVIL